MPQWSFLSTTLDPAFLVVSSILQWKDDYEQIETHSRKHIHGNTFRNTFKFLIYQPKIKRKSFESPIPLKTILKCKIWNKNTQSSSLGFGVKIP